MSSAIKIYSFCFTRILAIKDGKEIESFIENNLTFFKIFSKTYSPKSNATLIPI